jgi:hypothetical protein
MGQAVEDGEFHFLKWQSLILPSIMEGHCTLHYSIQEWQCSQKTGLGGFPTYDRQGFIKLMSETMLILGIAD